MNKNNHKILVVDDDPDILDAMQLVLQEAGYTVTTGANGSCIKGLSKNNLPGLILLDVLLSGQDGREICAELKKNIVTKHVPVIMVSAHPSAGKNALEYGANDFIAKPFDIDMLIEKVRKYIQ